MHIMVRTVDLLSKSSKGLYLIFFLQHHLHLLGVEPFYWVIYI
jgi:hypothetical protein